MILQGELSVGFCLYMMEKFPIGNFAIGSSGHNYKKKHVVNIISRIVYAKIAFNSTFNVNRSHH